MKITTHKGTNTIGGSCIEVQTESTRIIMDFGIPLVTEGGKQVDLREYKALKGPELLRKGLLPAVRGIYSWDKKEIDAVLISHSHLDHYGFLEFIDPTISVYMSRGCKDLIGVAHYLGQSNYDPKDAIVVPAWETFGVGDISITPYLVDHSAFDSFAFLIEGGGKRIFYTGDFRGHGRKSILFNKMVETPPQNIDALIVEGTTLGGRETESATENDVTKEITEVLRHNKKLILVACSSQHIDRIASVYKACRATGKTFVIDAYTAYVLDRVKREGITIPQFNWRDIRVFFATNSYTEKMGKDGSLFKFKGSKIQYEEINERRENMVVIDSFFTRNQFAEKGYLSDSILIYSQWQGYLKKEESFWREHNVEIKKIHSSGHMYKEELEKFIKALDPAKIIPVHTLAPDKFEEYFGKRTVILSDGQSIEV